MCILWLYLIAEDVCPLPHPLYQYYIASLRLQSKVFFSFSQIFHFSHILHSRAPVLLPTLSLFIPLHLSYPNDKILQSALISLTTFTGPFFLSCCITPPPPTFPLPLSPPPLYPHFSYPTFSQPVNSPVGCRPRSQIVL